MIMIMITDPDQVTDSGRTAMFNCSVSGFPVLNVYWWVDWRFLKISIIKYIIHDKHLNSCKILILDTYTYTYTGFEMGSWSCQVRGSLPAPPHLSSGQAGDDEWSTILTTGTTTIIITRDVGREDGGMYQCIAGNEEEESQAAAQLVLGGQLIMMMMMVMVVRVDLMVLVMVTRKRWGDGVKGPKVSGGKKQHGI